MKKTNYLLIYILSVSSMQSVYCKSLGLITDYSIFAYDNQNGLLEIYSSFPQSKIHYTKTDDQYTAYTIGQLQLFQNDSLYDNYYWKNRYTIADTTEISSYNMIYDQVNFKLPMGKYRSVLRYWDLNQPENRDSVEFNILVFSEHPDSLSMSDIELAREIRKSEKSSESPFYKNYLIIDPNPERLYHSDLSDLKFYIEIYGLNDRIRQNRFFQYYVTDSNDHILADIEKTKKDLLKITYPTIETGTIGLISLPSGNYLIHAEITDSLGNVYAQKTKAFSYLMLLTDRPSGQYLAQFQASEFNQMDSTDIDIEFQSVWYLLDKEYRYYWEKSESMKQKREFLYLFWNRNNPKTGASVYAFRHEYLKRVRFANDHYRTMWNPGWKTDRGRVYVLYGPPDYIDRFPNEPNLKPYEIWNYNGIENGVIFVFADLESYSKYQLIHSTKIGELQDYNYKDILKRGSY